MGASRHVPSQAVRALASYEMRQPSKRGVPFSFDDAARRRFPSRGGLDARGARLAGTTAHRAKLRRVMN